MLARQAGDAVAASYVNRRPQPPHRKPVNPPAFEQDRHVWTKLVYHEPDRPTALRPIAPLARNLGGGWVLMRSSWRDDAVILLWDAGQPYFRSRQHFDAGHFQIYRRGLLAPGAGVDVALEAARSKGGQARIADRPADWDLFAQATIAHNCMTVYDRLHVMTHFGRPWPARGNQRIIEGGYRASQLETRRTGRLLRFETNAAYSYAAADLAEAYPESHVLAYTRQVLLLNLGLIVVCDRIESADPEHVKTWHLQLPNRPTIDGAALPDARRVRGTDDAGIWQFGAVQHALSTTNLDGRLFVQTLEPPDAQWRVIGGPKTPQRIPEGTFAGRDYFGGDPDGFEHWLVPSHAAGRNNATYRLGKPTRLGPQFGLRSVWGRLDVQAPTERTEVVFVHLLTPAEVFARTPARTQWQRNGDTGTLTGTIGQHTFRITLALAGPLTGSVTLTDRPTGTVLYQKPLTDKIEPNAPVPTTAP